MGSDRRTEIKVGMFVLGLLLAGVVAVVLLGKSKHVFESRVRLHATFADVLGLVQGAPVRVAGVNVGTVSQIMFVRGQPRPLIRVDLEVKASALGLIRSDSLARISNQGLLGDKIVEVTAGSTDTPGLQANGDIKTAPAPDYDQMLKQAAAVLDDTKHVADRVAAAVDEIADPKTIAEVRESVVHIHGLLHATEKGEGLAHALFYDRRTADELTRLESNLSQVALHVDRGVQHLDALLAATDDDGRQLLNNVSRAARSVGATADQVQRSHVVANLDKATGDLVAITANVRSGQGTLGALVADPTVYEQLVQVLGGVGRSRVLRALVRYAISRDDERGVAKRVVDQKNVPDVRPPKVEPPAEPAEVSRGASSAKR
jgi:phospholipid/cholesterol/gamma-HCH transport system substrate-binding protein